MAPRFRLRHYLLIGFLISSIPYSILLEGSKGRLFVEIMNIVFAYWCSGRRFTVKKMIVVGILLVFSILAGFTYGLTFRQIKGDESLIGMGEYFKLGTSTISMIGDMDISDNAEIVMENVLLRFEGLTSLAIVVANYDTLRPIEEYYDIRNNIWTYTWTSIIPRFFWPEKPLISHARAYSKIYYDFEDNSYAMTLFGDLLRNFGPFGIPFGMAILGIYLRVLYTSLIDHKDRNMWEKACYFILLGQISYGSFYGNIIPGTIRAVIILFIGGFIINIMYSYGFDRKFNQFVQ